MLFGTQNATKIYGGILSQEVLGAYLWPCWAPQGILLNFRSQNGFKKDPRRLPEPPNIDSNLTKWGKTTPREKNPTKRRKLQKRQPRHSSTQSPWPGKMHEAITWILHQTFRSGIEPANDCKISSFEFPGTLHGFLSKSFWGSFGWNTNQNFQALVTCRNLTMFGLTTIPYLVGRPARRPDLITKMDWAAASIF